jgi:hypothetical protein
MVSALCITALLVNLALEKASLRPEKDVGLIPPSRLICYLRKTP